VFSNSFFSATFMLCPRGSLRRPRISYGGINPFFFLPLSPLSPVVRGPTYSPRIIVCAFWRKYLKRSRGGRLFFFPPPSGVKPVLFFFPFILQEVTEVKGLTFVQFSPARATGCRRDVELFLPSFFVSCGRCQNASPLLFPFPFF